MQGFEGNERFEVIARLGRGSMGAVYQVLDRECSRRMALKTVGHVEGDALLRFKREFRELQAVQHPNIVELGELYEERGEWFFTMEIVDGDDFLTYVRGESARWLAGSSERPAFGVYSHDPTLTSIDPAEVSVTLHRQEEPAPTPSGEFDEVRLRRSLGQLALAVAALHRHGRVHRDLKSSNVLVTHEGRVVVIDFGLVTVLEPQLQSMEVHVVGTVAYMAPEQAAGTPVGPEADWYSVGVMLYEALTGTLPFSGPPLQVLVQKQTEAPPSPRSLVPEVPEDLDRLCMDLLRLDPRQRPSEAAILARLHVVPEDAHGPPSLGSLGGPHRHVFVGRAHELTSLREAMERTLRGQPALVGVVGASGIGKSALVERFLHETATLTPHAVFLVGKCYEHEHVPFKALDGVVDQLSRFLRRAAEEDVAELVPPDVELLERTFPVLKRVPAIAEARGQAPDIRDPQERRVRVRTALRTLVGNVARRWPTVIVIDDLQWSDEDSFGLLSELVRRPGAPPCLLVFTARTPTESEGALRRILASSQRIDVGPLSLEESEELARHVAGASLAPARLRSLALQAEGFPFFLDTLLRRPLGDGSTEPLLDLDAAIGRIVGELEPGSRELLEVVCSAGARIAPEIAGEAAGLEPDQLAPRVRVLRHAKLVRTTGSRPETLEPYHDRIRTAVVGALDAKASRRVHLALARAYDAHHGPPEALASHFFAAGDVAKASKYLALAARAATEALAFQRAADFYARAIELGQGTRKELCELAIRRGEALASAGDGPRAAEAFAAAVPDVGPIEALALRVRIAEQLLTSGHHEDGVGAALAFSDSLQLAYPLTPRAAWIELFRLRALVALRGYSVRLRDPDSMSREDLLRIDSCWALAKGLASHDLIRSQVFHTKGLLRALDSGEPYRIARALAFEALNLAATRPADLEARTRLLGRASDLAERSGQPHAIAFVSMMRLYTRYVGECDWAVAYSLPSVEEQFRTRCSDVAWETGLCTTSRALCLAWLGRWKELSLTVEQVADEARARGFHYVYAHLLGHARSLTDVLRGNYDEAHRHVDAARGSIEGDPSPVEAFFYRSWHLRVDLAQGAVETAVARMEATERTFVESLLLRAPIMQTIDRHDRAFVALAAARDGREKARAKHRRDAKHAAVALEHDHTAPGRAFGALALAGLASLDGDTKRALALLDEAKDRFADLDMRGYRHAALARRGQLLGNANGAELLERALSELRAEGAVRPEAIVDMLSPGFPRLSGPALVR